MYVNETPSEKLKELFQNFLNDRKPFEIHFIEMLNIHQAKLEIIPKFAFYWGCDSDFYFYWAPASVWNISSPYRRHRSLSSSMFIGGVLNTPEERDPEDFAFKFALFSIPKQHCLKQIPLSFQFTKEISNSPLFDYNFKKYVDFIEDKIPLFLTDSSANLRNFAVCFQQLLEKKIKSEDEEFLKNYLMCKLTESHFTLN